jgi:hypothetical protein
MVNGLSLPKTIERTDHGPQQGHPGMSVQTPACPRYTKKEGGTMTKRLSTILIAVPLFAFVPALGQTPTDQGAAANVRQSGQYENALGSNPSFRAKRIQQECGPITDPQMHQQCVASFGGSGASSSTTRRQQ